MKKGWRKNLLGCVVGAVLGVLIFHSLGSCAALHLPIDRLAQDIRDHRAKEKIPLHAAARRGDLQKVERLIGAGADVDEKDDKGKTALHKAAASGRREVVKLLLQNGADLEADCNSWTPLMLAAWHGETGVIEELVDGGAKINGANPRAKTPLLVAVEAAKEQSVRTLIEKGADVNLSSEAFPERVLDAAVIRGHVRIAEMLLDNGADLQARYSQNGMTVAHYATALGDRKMLRLLKEYGADMEAEDDYGRNPAKTRQIVEGFNRRKLIAAKKNGELFDCRAIVQMPYLASTPQGFNWMLPPRIGFAIGDGSIVVTAAHCVGDMIENSRKGILVRPKVVSKYYGDIAEAEIVGVDEEADVAVLKVGWGAHPALELASAEEVLAASEISIAGYPQERNVKKSSDMREVFFERMPVLKVNLEGGKEAIVLGGGRYAGPGWSGCPMLCAETGKVAGVLGRGTRLGFGDKIVCRDLEGCNVEAIRSVLEENGIRLQDAGCGRADSEVADGEKGFGLLLDLFEAMAKKDCALAEQKAKSFAELRPESVEGHVLVAETAQMVAAADNIHFSETAERHYKKALELDDRKAGTHAGYGRYLVRCNQDRDAEGLAELEKALQIEPENTFVLTNLVDIYIKTDAAKAEKYSRSYVQLHPDIGQAWYLLSAALNKRGDSESEEIETGRKAVELDGKDVPHLHRRRLADALRDASQFAEAEQQYKLMFDEGHECTNCWMAYATLLERMGPERYADAIEAINNAERLNRSYEKKAEQLRKWRHRLSGETQPALSEVQM